MPIPEEIRKVIRPVNTVIIDNGSDSPKRYAVRQRAGVKYVPGKNPQPHNGKVIGHIINNEFVPLQPKVSTIPDILSYGSSAFVKSVSSDILDDLMKVFSVKDAFSIITIASLRVIKPGISSRRLSTHYGRTFISKFYPRVALSENTVSTFLKHLGQDGKKRRDFFKLRILKVMEDHHVAIDGMLKQDASTVNDLSAFSYKAKVRGRKEISVIYAYDIENMEPICAKVYPGNCIDASVYSSFINDNNIHKGIIVADKGFPPSKIKQELHDNPDLHFLTPLKRNDVRIVNNEMLSFNGVLTGTSDNVVYKKQVIKGGRFLYSFQSYSKANAEANLYFTIKKQKEHGALPNDYETKSKFFGVIVFESDKDLDPQVVYRCYKDRWLLELVFDYYKNDLNLDTTNVQNDFSVIGSEFINFISTLITCRLIREAQKKKLLEKMSYKDLMEDLSEAWRLSDSPSEIPTSDDKYWIHTLKISLESLEALSLSKKSYISIKSKAENKQDIAKRPRGRPKKNTL